MRLGVVVFVGVCWASAAVAEDAVETARKYVEFWQGVEGRWKVTMSGGGTEAASADAGSFIWELKKSPSGVCFTDEGIVDGKANSHGIHAYDPEKKCWLMISYGQPQLATDPLFAMTWIPLDITKSTHLTEGTTFVAEGKCVMRDGTVIKTRRRWLFSKVQKDLLEVRFTEGIDNGAPLPDGIGVFERIAKQRDGVPTSNDEPSRQMTDFCSAVACFH